MVMIKSLYEEDILLWVEQVDHTVKTLDQQTLDEVFVGA